MLIHRSQREPLYRSGWMKEVSSQTLLVGSSNWNWLLNDIDTPKRKTKKNWGSRMQKSGYQLVVYAPTCALRSSFAAPRVSYARIRPPFGIWHSRRQGPMNLRCKPICCTVRWPEQTLWGNKLESSISRVHPQFKTKHDSFNLPNLSLQCFPTTTPCHRTSLKW